VGLLDDNINPPGTGKTLLARSVANSISATFLRMVDSEFIQKYVRHDIKLVRELFMTAWKLAIQDFGRYLDVYNEIKRIKRQS
jgi:AAA+ superfamily predicted ATPase